MYVPVLVAVLCGAGFIYWVSGVSAYSTATEYDVAVVGVHGPYRFTFQHVSSEGDLYGDPFTEDICRDYVSPEKDFPLGIIINKLIHTDEGSCWSLNPEKHAGYFKRRDKDKNPLFAKGVS